MNPPNQDRWNHLCGAVGANETAKDWYARLTKAYNEPQRHYHNWQHIAECLAEFDGARHLAQQPDAVELALWFHDAVYDSKAADNEERSAALAKQCLASCGVSQMVAEAVESLVMATKHHEAKEHVDAGLTIDVDLSILGREEARFFEYERQIRAEYAWVPAEVFSAKRAEILEKFLARERIYTTELFRRKYEKQARANLAASIRGLKAQGQ